MRSRTHVQARAPRVIAKTLSWLKCSFGFFHRMLQKNQKIKIKKQLLLFGQPKSNNWFGGAKKCLEGLLTGTPYICLPRTASPHGPGKEEGTSSSCTFQSCRSIHGNNLVPLSSKLCHPNSHNHNHSTHPGRRHSSGRDREREGLLMLPAANTQLGGSHSGGKAFTTSRCAVCSEAEGPRNDHRCCSSL